MRIGRTIIDTDSMSIEELSILEHELHQIRRRKEKAEYLKKKMQELLAEAKENNFIFVDGHKCVIPEDDIDILDEQ